MIKLKVDHIRQAVTGLILVVDVEVYDERIGKELRFALIAFLIVQNPLIWLNLLVGKLVIIGLTNEKANRFTLLLALGHIT